MAETLLNYRQKTGYINNDEVPELVSEYPTLSSISGLYHINPTMIKII